METCSSCGARLSPDIDWCPQCYTRTGPPPPARPAVAPTAPAPVVAPPVTSTPATVATAAPAPAPEAHDVAQPLDPKELPVDALMQQLRAQHSRIARKESTLTTGARVALSAGLLLLCILGYFLVIAAIGISPSWRSFEMFLPAMFTVGGALLWIVWRPVLLEAG
jgi:uncharacterized membrane protein